MRDSEGGIGVPLEWRGVSGFSARMASMRVENEAATVLAVTAGLKQIREDAVDQLMLKEHAKGTATPSAPGEPPAMVTGGLKASVREELLRILGPGLVEGRVGPTKPYSRIQELGGTAGHGAKLPARPYLRPALATALPKLLAIFRAAWSARGVGR